jgi:hypothetical protein
MPALECAKESFKCCNAGAKDLIAGFSMCARPFNISSMPTTLPRKGVCSFEPIVQKYGLTDDPALALLGKIVNGADTDNSLWNQPQGPGLEAIAEGFRHLGLKDDRDINAAEWIVYDALYAYCREMGRQAKPNGMFRS